MAMNGTPPTPDQLQRMADEELLKLLQGNSNQPQPQPEFPREYLGTFTSNRTYPVWPKATELTVDQVVNMYGLAAPTAYGNNTK
jgi:hypothetical protein